jgi:hypothetical protein
MAMLEINARNCQFLRVQINEKLVLLAEELGIDITVGRCRFNDKNAEFKLEVNVKDEKGKPVDKKITDFLKNCKRWGLRPEDLDCEFDYNSKRYRLVGANVRAPKFPLICQLTHDTSYGTIGGTLYKFTPNMFREGRISSR